LWAWLSGCAFSPLWAPYPLPGALSEEPTFSFVFSGAPEGWGGADVAVAMPAVAPLHVAPLPEYANS
jgi:hypothetical protein